MFDIKWGIFAGGIALVLAFTTSLLLGQTSLLVAGLRAICFAALFFGLGIGVSIIINKFIPELLSQDSENDIVNDVFSAESPGSRVNITIGDYAEPALPDEDGNTANVENVGDFSQLVANATSPSEKVQADNSKDIDQSLGSGYTATINDEEFPPALASAEDGDSGGFSMDFGAFLSDSGSSSSNSSSGMGELDSYIDSFSGFSTDDDPIGIEEAPVMERKVSGNKPVKFEGDFNAKEIAAGIRTVLEKDKRG